MREFRYRVLALILALLVPVSHAVADTTSSGLILRLPGENWELVVEDPYFRYLPSKATSDGTRAWAFGEDPVHGLRMTVFIEDIGLKEPDPEACRRHYWSTVVKNPTPMTRVRFGEIGEFAAAEYVVLGYRGVRPSRMHVHGYQVHDGLCVGLHVALTPHKLLNRHLAARVLDTVRFSETD